MDKQFVPDANHRNDGSCYLYNDIPDYVAGEVYVKRIIVLIGFFTILVFMMINCEKDSPTETKNAIFEEIKAFADSHWRFKSDDPTEITYYRWYLDIFATIDPLLLDPVYTTHDDSLNYINAHHYFDFDANGNIIKTQQYYEMIGKYDQFVYGWNDVTFSTYPAGNDSAISLNRDEYENMRYDSNKKLKNRDNALKFMLLNRIVSAIDAARFTWKRNQSIEAAEKMIRMKMVARRENEHEILMLVFTKKF